MKWNNSWTVKLVSTFWTVQNLLGKTLFKPSSGDKAFKQTQHRWPHFKGSGGGGMKNQQQQMPSKSPPIVMARIQISLLVCLSHECSFRIWLDILSLDSNFLLQSKH